MARDENSLPMPETRGRRGKSARIKDFLNQMHSYKELTEAFPNTIAGISLASVFGWLIYTMAPRIDVYPDEQGAILYNGKRTSKIIIAHPNGRGGAFIFGEIVLLFNLPSGD